ncbi:MAG: PilZ domain-containing protein [Candidatus Kuenenia stuttgartiensis]|nr:PilZ domain-containing protein [Candidatus Kuenenia stuttgartiensis]
MKHAMRLEERREFNKDITIEMCESDNCHSIQVKQEVARGVDISKSGLGLITKIAFKNKDVLKVYVPVDYHCGTIVTYAEVVWLMPCNSFRVGLCFLG